MTQRVFVDANVFFSKTLTDWLFLLRNANPGMYQVHTSEDVLAETIANMRKRRPDAPGHTTRRRIELLRTVVDEVVPDYPARKDPQAAPFSGKDDHDYHVHAAATASQADVVLTCNDPRDITRAPDQEHYTVHHPDDFFCLVVASRRACLQPVIEEQLAYWAQRPSQLQLDDALRRADCTAFAAEVRHELRRIARHQYVRHDSR